MMQNMTMQGIYDKDLQDPTQYVANGNDYTIYTQEKTLVVRYLNQDIATTFLDIHLMINSKFKEVSVTLMDNDENLLISY